MLTNGRLALYFSQPMGSSFVIGSQPFFLSEYVLSVYSCVCLFVCSFFVSLSLYHSGILGFCLSLFLSFHLSVFPSFRLSVFLSFCLSVFLSFSLSVFACHSSTQFILVYWRLSWCHLRPKKFIQSKKWMVEWYGWDGHHRLLLLRAPPVLIKLTGVISPAR